MSGPRIVALANQKGGVGKTTTAVNLSAVVAASHRVLLIDLDPQGNASTALGRQRGSRRLGAYDIFTDVRPIPDLTQSTVVPQLQVVVASPDLVGAELELVGMPRRERHLRSRLREDEWVARSFDYVFLDCPPSLGLLTVNALTAADAVLVPLQCEFFALEGVSQLTHTLERVQRGFNPDLRIDGVVLTMHDRRANLSEQVAADVRSVFGTRVYRTVIPRNVRISEAPSHGLPIALYDPRSAGALAYAQLGAEFLDRDGQRRRIEA